MSSRGSCLAGREWNAECPRGILSRPVSFRLARIATMIAAFLVGYALGMVAPRSAQPDVEAGRGKKWGWLLSVVLLLATQGTAGEQVLHEERQEAVITLIDEVRSGDASTFRWVVIVAIGAEWSTLVDRDRGRLFICLGRARTREIRYVDGRPQLQLGECVEVYSGVVTARKR